MLFRRYLKEIGEEEYFVFWEKIEKFRGEAEEQLVDTAKSILNDFVKDPDLEVAKVQVEQEKDDDDNDDDKETAEEEEEKEKRKKQKKIVISEPVLTLLKKRIEHQLKLEFNRKINCVDSSDHHEKDKEIKEK